MRREGICFRVHRVHRAETIPASFLVGQLRSPLSVRLVRPARGSTLDGTRAEQTPRIYLSRPNCLGISEHQATTSDDAVQNDTITLVFLKKVITLILSIIPNPRWEISWCMTIILEQYHPSICYPEPHRLRITSQGSLRCTAHHHRCHSRILPSN